MKPSFLIVFSLVVYSFDVFSQNTFTEVSEMLGFTQVSGAEAVAVGDFNNDGFEDLYFCFAYKKNQFWKNIDGTSFEDVTEQMGLALEESSLSYTAVWGDINNDGFLDLYVANKGMPDKLFRNNGGETFTEITQPAGIYQLGYPNAVNMADVNNDGFLDIYVANFFDQNVLYINNGDETFSNKTYQSGALDIGKVMGTVFFDYDKDGDLDLYIVHDGFEPNFLYKNDGTGKFTEVAEAAGAATKSFGMGVDVGDINNDGWMDLYITNLGNNILLLNNGDGTFSDISTTAGVDDYGMGWGCTFLDFNQDGLLDIFACNDSHFSPYPNVLYKNLGGNTFERMDGSVTASDLFGSYGTARLDFDLDGREDLVVVNKSTNEYIQFFKNQDSTANWLTLKLEGVNSNRQGIGAKIKLIDNLGVLHYHELLAGHGWKSQNSNFIHIGLGEATDIQELTIYWPSGLEQSISSLELNTFYTVMEGQIPTEGLVPMASAVGATNQSSFDVSIFPNPHEGEFSVKFNCEKAGNYQVIIRNLLGQVLTEKTIQQAKIGAHIVSFDGIDVAASQNLVIELVGEGRRLVRWF